MERTPLPKPLPTAWGEGIRNLQVGNVEMRPKWGLLFLFGQCAQRAGGDAAIDEQSLAGDVGAGVGGQEDDRAFEVLRLAGALERDAVGEVFDPFLVFIHDSILPGLEPSR